jgi:hypothetical protein
LSLTLSPRSYLRRVATIEAPGNPSSLMNMLVEIMPLKLDLSLQSPGWTLSCGNSRLNLNTQGRTYEYIYSPYPFLKIHYLKVSLQ